MALSGLVSAALAAGSGRFRCVALFLTTNDNEHTGCGVANACFEFEYKLSVVVSSSFRLPCPSIFCNKLELDVQDCP